MMEDKIKRAIERVQRLRDEAQAEYDRYDVPGEWLDSDGSWKDWESEAAGAEIEGRIAAFEAVLDVLTIIAHGGEPEQGKSLTTEEALALAIKAHPLDLAERMLYIEARCDNCGPDMNAWWGARNITRNGTTSEGR